MPWKHQNAEHVSSRAMVPPDFPPNHLIRHKTLAITYSTTYKDVSYTLFAKAPDPTHGMTIIIYLNLSVRSVE